jgi:hypothetical protein
MHQPPAQADYQSWLASYSSYRDVVTYEPSGRVFREMFSSWISPSQNTVVADLQWRPPSDLAQAWFGIEVQRPGVDVNTYQRVGALRDYSALTTKFSTYQDMRDWDATGGWSQGSQHLSVRAEVRSGDDERAYWAVPVISVNGEADIDLVVVDDLLDDVDV